MSMSILKIFSSKNKNTSTSSKSSSKLPKPESSMEDRKIRESVRRVLQTKSGRIKPTSGRTSITDRDTFNGPPEDTSIKKSVTSSVPNGYNNVEIGDSFGRGHNRHRSSMEELNGHDVADGIARIAENVSRNMQVK